MALLTMALLTKVLGGDFNTGKEAPRAMDGLYELLVGRRKVQAYGCSALGNCAIGDGEAAVRARGLPLVLAAMAALPADAELQSKACWATG